MFGSILFQKVFGNLTYTQKKNHFMVLFCSFLGVELSFYFIHWLPLLLFKEKKSLLKQFDNQAYISQTVLQECEEITGIF